MEGLYLKQGRLPLWSRVIGSLFFAMMFLCLYRIVIGFINNMPNLLDIVLIIVGLIFGMTFSMTTNLHFDIEKGRFKDEKQIGPIKFGWWEPIFDFEYVAVSKMSNDFYALNLWIKGNDHFSIATYEDELPALKQANYIAKKLDIDIWNATDPRNGFWVAQNTDS